ncbi:lysophospholipid acyltransferase family protein [Limnovirga soli]|uniref:1-acyl-sn-glycerol-3-phosphate acyltransferase n=1 Tax=Limnovirga soli TaxID=2656915 RepID=A0A8J8FAU7_9BACT|nr:lysophospholipid acyltransferase family protein [Limnovirga soli]NNV54355.1 1-acyl-sn-glycerol-3-phosphate acyltransferase [Limnovirga soli]
MKLFKEIFGRIWALYGLLLFVSTMIIADLFYLICYILKEPYKARFHRQISRVWMTFYLYMIASPVKVKGAEHFAKDRNFVVVCNHNSLMDIPLTTPFMPRPNKTIGKTSFAYIPLVNVFYIIGSILVDRKSTKSRLESYIKMKKVLSSGFDMVIYPEGTRNRSDDPLKPFYDGAFKLAIDTGKAVIPALLFNTKKVLPINKPFYLYPHKMEMHFLPPVESDGLTAKELKEKVFNIMWNYYAANS